MITEVAEFHHRIGGIDESIKELVDPVAPNLLKITGISHNRRPYWSPNRLNHRGFQCRKTRPLHLLRTDPVYSSGHERDRLHRGGNRRLNSVLYTAAIAQNRFNPTPNTQRVPPTP
jgi:hypothetical protein